jgi:hypothetical protein
MRTTVLPFEPSTIEAPCFDEIPRHGLGINEIEAAGWGASWQPGGYLPAWIDADDVEPRRSWLIREGLSP